MDTQRHVFISYKDSPPSVSDEQQSLIDRAGLRWKKLGQTPLLRTPYESYWVLYLPTEKMFHASYIADTRLKEIERCSQEVTDKVYKDSLL